MKISILGSGSSGNSAYIETEDTKILIDAGFSGKKIKIKLENIGVDIDSIDALLITHEHGDHILGAGIISRKHNIPIYITKESYEAGQNKLGKIKEEMLKFIDGNFSIKNLNISPFDVLHDARRTLGFRIENHERKTIAISTDIGHITNIVKENFKGVNVAVIETNYDYSMLMTCSYPWDLKARVKGRNGHLSNGDAAKLIRDIYHDGLQKVYLSHVSKDSNSYDMAYKTVRDELEASEINLLLEVAKRDSETKLYAIS